MDRRLLIVIWAIAIILLPLAILDKAKRLINRTRGLQVID